ATRTPIVNVFGSIDPVAQVTPTPAIIPTPRTTPTRTTTLDWLQSIFIPNTTEESVTQIDSVSESKESPLPVGTDNHGVLWGTAATAAIGAAIAYAEEEKRKREEE